MPFDSNDEHNWRNEDVVVQQQDVRTMRRRTSEYASVTPRSLIKDVEHQMSKSDCDVSRNKSLGLKDSSAILKITEKYDSLGSLRASLEKLDINDIINELDDGHDIKKKDHNDDDDDDNNDGHVDGVEKDHQRTVVTRHFYNHSNSVDVSDVDVLQVEAFFRSHKTVVNVCPTLANVYFSTTSSTTTTTTAGSSPTVTADVNWQLAYTGIPVLLLDSGETRSRTKKRIQIVISEKGTGFLLWKDTIDNLSNYRASDAHFHTMYLSMDHRRMVGLSFDNASAARDFYERIETLTSDPANISLSGPGSTKAAKKAAAAKQKQKRHKDRVRLPNKTDISQPCCFQHVTRVELGDREQFVTLATLTGSAKKTESNDRKVTTTTTAEIVARPN